MSLSASFTKKSFLTPQMCLMIMDDSAFTVQYCQHISPLCGSQLSSGDENPVKGNSSLQQIVELIFDDLQEYNHVMSFGPLVPHGRCRRR